MLLGIFQQGFDNGAITTIFSGVKFLVLRLRYNGAKQEGFMRVALILLILPWLTFAKPDEPVKMGFPDDYYTQFNWETFEQWESVNQKIDAANVDYSLLQAAIFYYTNQYRSSRKLKPVAYQPALGSAAICHAKDMGEKGFYDHVNKYDRSMRTAMDRAKRFGFLGSIGENLALEFLLDYKPESKYWYELTSSGFRYYYGDSGTNKGYVPAHTYLSLGKSIVKAWINSPGHRSNLLHKDFKYLGVGVYLEPKSQGNKNIPRIYATQVFGG